MRRRNFCELLASAGAFWPLLAQAQQPDRVRRVGMLYGATPEDAAARARHEAFLEAFGKLGWVDGRNVRSMSAGPKETRRGLIDMPLSWSGSYRTPSW